MSLKPTQKSAMTSETINALVFVRRFLLLQTRKIVNPFPVMLSNERNQLRNQYQVSICFNLKEVLINYRLLEIRVSQNVARVGAWRGPLKVRDGRAGENWSKLLLTWGGGGGLREGESYYWKVRCTKSSFS